MRNTNEVQFGAPSVRPARTTSAQREQFKETIAAIFPNTRKVMVKPYFSRLSAWVKYDGNGFAHCYGSNIEALYQKLAAQSPN